MLKNLLENGFIHIHNALNISEIEVWIKNLKSLYKSKLHDIDNSVGNVAFEHLLTYYPLETKKLIAHESVSFYLKKTLGRQCQLRSIRAHVNPGKYLQEWHMDFYDYWDQEKQSKSNLYSHCTCINTTFYLTDNTSETGRLRFLKDFNKKPIPQNIFKFSGYTDNFQNPFQKWCNDQSYIDLFPKAGDVIVFFSHIPHQGAKYDESFRANIVLHYQQNPMHPDINFVSDPQYTINKLGFAGTFPFKSE